MLITTIVLALMVQSPSATVDTTRAAFTKCLRTDMKKALEAKMEEAEYEMTVKANCSTEREAFRKAVIAGRLVRVTGRIERDGPVTHLIAERVEDVSPLLATLGRPVVIAPNDGRADETMRQTGGSRRPTARHPREQARKLFPSRDFH